VITLDQLRRELGLTPSEWRELQYAAIDREMSTRELIRSLICTMLVWCEVRGSEPVSIRQSQSTRSPERGFSDGTTSTCRKATRRT
jgi:hypothetical protein